MNILLTGPGGASDGGGADDRHDADRAIHLGRPGRGVESVPVCRAQGAARAHAVELARKAAGNAVMSNYAIINALPRIQDMARGDGLFVESFVSAMTAAAPEAEERLRAFIEKRAAKVARPDA